MVKKQLKRILLDWKLVYLFNIDSLNEIIIILVNSSTYIKIINDNSVENIVKQLVSGLNNNELFSLMISLFDKINNYHFINSPSIIQLSYNIKLSIIKPLNDIEMHLPFDKKYTTIKSLLLTNIIYQTEIFHYLSYEYNIRNVNKDKAYFKNKWNSVNKDYFNKLVYQIIENLINIKVKRF